MSNNDGSWSSYDVYWNSYLPIFMDRMSMSMREHMTVSVSEYGLTSAHAVYLIALELQGCMSQKDLSTFLDMDPANTNRVVKVLREKGMIYDDRINPDSRNYKIYLTAIGKKLAQKAMKETMDWMEGIMSDLPIEDVMNMRNTLIHILKNMGVDLGGYMGSKYANPFYTYLFTHPPVDGDLYHRTNITESSQEGGEDDE